MPTKVGMSSNLKPYVRPLFSSRARILNRAVETEKNDDHETYEMESLHDEEIEEETKNEWAVSVFKDNLREQLLRRQYQKRQNSCIIKLQQSGGTRGLQNISRHDVNYVLLWGAFHGQLNLMQFCAEKGADVSFTHGNNSFNALHLAAMAGSVDCCRWLLEKGCRIILTSDLMTPIHYAAIGNSKDVIKFLISYGCGLPSTALNSAVYANAIECVKLLLSLGADVNIYHEGMTPLHVATDLRYIECMEELLNDPRIDANLKTELKGYTAMHLAAENAYADCIELLLKKGARINETNNKLQTPLHLACKMEYLECVEILLENRALVNEKDIDHKTPLHAAIAKSRSSLAKVQSLVRWKANVNVADRYGYTPLHLAALHESEECATFLILNGANVAAETQNGVSALNMINRKTPKSVPAIWTRLTKSLAYNTEQSLKFSFRELITNSTIGEIGFLYTLQKEDHKDILMHPLCRAFLYLKWEKVKVIYYFRVFFVILTTGILSFLVLNDIIRVETKPPNDACKPSTFTNETVQYNLSSENVSKILDSLNSTMVLIRTILSSEGSKNAIKKDLNNGTSNIKTVENEPQCSNATALNVVEPIVIFFETHRFTLWWVALILVALNVFRNLSCKNAYPSFKRYLTNNLNLFEYIIMIMVIILFCTVQGTNEKMIFAPVRKTIGTGVILLAWTYLTLVIGQLPFFGTYITMFNKVFKELIKLLTVYFCLLIGFTFTFSAILHDTKEKFDDLITGFAQTMVMMTGELEGNTFITNNGSYSPVQQGVAVVAIVSFIVVVNMALMNLLIGIAVSDVEGLRATADLSKLVHQTKLIYYLEFAFFRGYLPEKFTFTKMFKKCLYVSPDFYRVVMYVRPLNPFEKRLPQDIMKEGLQLALNKNKPDNDDDEIVCRLEKVEKKIGEIHKLLLMNFSNKFLEKEECCKDNECDEGA